MSLPGAATVEGTERFRQRFAACDPGHFRRLQGCWASSIGLGTYLGDADEASDERYAQAIRALLDYGANVMDTAVNYRCQRSERVIGRALSALAAEGAVARDEVIVCTKGGYVPFDAQVPEDPGRYVAETVINAGLASYDELAGGCHCLSPRYLDHALRQSLANLRLETLDVYYLHNPEEQLAQIGRAPFAALMEAAFRLLEQHADAGRLRGYGIATWYGLRRHPDSPEALHLEELVRLAERAGGTRHRFRAVQLPYNLAMPEAASFRNQPLGGGLATVLEAASALQLSVVASASLLQGRLTRLPEQLAEQIPGLATPAQRAVQFVRSTPGITTALVGMQQPRHVAELLALAQQPALAPEQIGRIFDREHRVSRAAQ